MESVQKEQLSRGVFLGCLIFAVSMLCVVVFFNVPVARQVFSFLFLTIVPGGVAVYVLGLNELSKLEKLLISVGLSLAFLMMAGVLVNELLPIVGLSRPLQVVPLMIVLIAFVMFGAGLIYIRKGGIDFRPFENLRHDLLILLLFVLPFLSILGTFLVNVYDNNVILLVMLMLIPLLFGVLVLSRKVMSPTLFVAAVFVIALSLLYQASLFSQYIFSYGSDSATEYFVFKFTEANQYWSLQNPFGSILYGRFYSMLSITILPTFYSTISNIDSTLLFKILYPLILALVPLCLYQIWQKYIGMKYALIAAFLLMAQNTFYTEMIGLNRQIVGELFFALLLLVLLNNKMKRFNKLVLFVIFSFGLVTSHYSLSEIFFVFLAVTFAYAYITKRTSRKVSAFVVLSFMVIMLSWYIYTSGAAAFESILTYGNYVLAQLGNFFSPTARGQYVLLGIGASSAPTILSSISRAFAYVTEFLIVVGFVGLVTKRVKALFDRDFRSFIFIAMAFLAALIVVPGLANTLNMTRFYHILLFFLAPLCVLGAEFLANLFSSLRASVFSKHKEILVAVFLLAILLPYFLFQTGFIYEVTKSEYGLSVPLSEYRIDPLQLYSMGYVDTYSVFGAQWLSKHINVSTSFLYSDVYSYYEVLTSYGMIYEGDINMLTNLTKLSPGGTVYLSTFNTQEKAIPSGSSSISWNFTELSFNIRDLNKIYTNGYSQIYQNPP